MPISSQQKTIPLLPRMIDNSPSKNNEAFAEFQYYRLKSYENHQGEPAILKRARAFEYALKNMTLSIEGIFAGSQRAAFPHVYHHFTGKQSKVDCYPEDPNYINKLTGRRFEAREYQDALRYWDQEDEYAKTEKGLLTDEEKALFDSMTVIGKRVTGHMIANYEPVLGHGLEAVIQDAQARMEEGSSSEKRLFYEAVKISAEAVINWAERYSKLAKQEARSTNDHKREEELKRIAEACKKVPGKGATNFYEALQSFWLLHSALMLEQMTPYASSFGRFDQYMFPFYIKDIEAGMTTEEAKQMLTGFYAKANEGDQVSQNLLIGGLKANPGRTLPQEPGEVDVSKLLKDGHLVDATNDLSRLILDSIDEPRLPQPSVALRYHRSLPKDFFHEALHVAMRRGGIPAIHNDHSVIPTMVRAGYSPEDAINYVIAGCQEFTAVDDNSATTAGRMSLPEIIRRVTVNQSFDNYESLLTASKQVIKDAIHKMVVMERKYDEMQWTLRPVPFLSAMMPHCMEEGKDYRAGGTKYNFSGCFAVGLANAANMLAALKKCVFDQKSIDYDELIGAIENNWEDRELLRSNCLSAPKFGNDDQYADDIARDLFEYICDVVSVERNARGGFWKPGFNTPTIHVIMGGTCRATPDGRNDFESFAYGTGPMMGTTHGIPTEIILSVGKLEQFPATHGTDFELAFSPGILPRESGLRILDSLVRTYFDLGGHHLQLHVVNPSVLRDAQKHPQKYPDLIVRVHGFSAKFIKLDEMTQKDIIARLEGGILFDKSDEFST